MCANAQNWNLLTVPQLLPADKKACIKLRPDRPCLTGEEPTHGLSSGKMPPFTTVLALGAKGIEMVKFNRYLLTGSLLLSVILSLPVFAIAQDTANHTRGRGTHAGRAAWVLFRGLERADTDA
jgi:hypothetical protein